MRLSRLLPPLLLGLCSLQALAATITGVRTWRAPDNTRIVLDLSEPVRYNLVSQEDRQVVIELENAELGVPLPLLPSHVGLVHEILFQPAGSRKRLQINLTGSVRPQVFVLPANDKYGPRLVIDLFDKMTVEPVAVPEETVADAGENRGRPVVIAIDAGHGGEDPGAIGGNGNHEKNVTLAIARKLAEHFRRHPGFRAHLTRDGDYFIPLQDRRKIARNRYKADIFISIHADSAPSPRARGASVFALSRKGANTATSRFAAALADHENKADQIGGVYMPDNGDSLLASVLADMVVEGSLSHSLRMGSAILGELDDLGHLHARQVEQAGFAVLKEPGMISVLVETGFISNPDEERNLISPDYQQRIAKSVFNGVRDYVQKYPLSGTYFAWSKENRGHKPRRAALESVASKPPVPDRNPLQGLVESAPPRDAAGVPSAATTVPSKPVKPTVATPEDPAKLMANPATVTPKPLPQASLPLSLEDFAGEAPLKPTTGKTDTIRQAQPSKRPVPVKPLPDKSVSAPQVKPSAAKPVSHTVARGDSLSSIAQQYGITLENLKSWNALTADTAVLGTRLRLVAPDTIRPLKAEKAEKKATEHVVKSGDSLSAIAVRYGVTEKALRETNKLKDDQVQLGKTLKIPRP